MLKKFMSLALALFFILAMSGCDSMAGKTETSEVELEASDATSPEAETEAESDATAAETKEKSESETEETAEAEYRDVIHVALPAAPPTLDPATSSSQIVWDISQNIFEPLFTTDAELNPQPMLAESYEVNEEMTVYSFKLRPDLKFHDGSAVTAEDVAVSMAHWNEVNGRAKKLFGEGKWEAIDELTVQVTLPEPATDLLTLMAAQTCYPAIMPARVLKNYDPEKGISEYIGTGPYKFVKWTPDVSIELEANPDYAPRTEEPSGFSGRREALTEKVVYYFVTDAATRIAGLLAGNYDIIDSVPNENYADLAQRDDITLLTDEGGTTTLFYNVQEGILADPKMRHAVQAALNFDLIMAGAYIEPELYTLAPGYMNPNSAQWGTDAGAEIYNQNDVAKAKKLMEEAGYKGEPIRILTTPDYKDMYDTCLFIVDQLEAAGFKTDFLEFDFPTFMEKRQD